jgi:diguanylate cyclase (GGDEF)-like protein
MGYKGKLSLNMSTLREGGMDVCGRDFTILVADDSPIDRKLLERALAQERCSVLFAKSGREAIGLCAEYKPDLVITDWVMPDFTGIDLCQQIRNDFQKSYTYIIILTCLTEKTKLVSGLAAGADDYLTKPFQCDELLARVGVGRRIIELHRQIEAKNRELEAMALTDPLTRLPNRRAIEEWAIRELTAAARYDLPFWVVMADLDNFKSVNDRYGHDAGDTVLKRFARVLKSETRSTDISGRIGGEEFLIVLRHTDREGALLAIERIREGFAAQRFSFGGRDIRITASFGIAGHGRNQSANLNRLIAQADAALYSAKRLGRNRVECAVIEQSAGAGELSVQEMGQTSPPPERRKHCRYPCVGEALVRAKDSDVSLRGQLSDISLGGCYLDMMNPLHSETEVALTLSLGGQVVHANGRVRASRQGFGMGIAFFEIGDADQVRLQDVIDCLSSLFTRTPTCLYQKLNQAK